MSCCIHNLIKTLASFSLTTSIFCVSFFFERKTSQQMIIIYSLEKRAHTHKRNKLKKYEYENDAVLLVDQNAIFISFYFCLSFNLLGFVTRHALFGQFTFMVLNILISFSRNLCELQSFRDCLMHIYARLTRVWDSLL